MPNHAISLEKAIEMTTRYCENRNEILKPEHQDKDILPKSETFSRDAIEYLLNQNNCERFRIYYGMDEDLKTHAILVGVDEHDEDILPPDPTSQDGEIAEMSLRCPVVCPPPSALNP